MKSNISPLKLSHLTCASVAVALWFGWSVGLAPAQPLNLDNNPSFDFSDNATADPLFTPDLLGLNSGQAGFTSVDAFRAFAKEVNTNFPPGMEVFIAYWGNPGYALLGGTTQPAAPLAAGSPLSLASAFQPPAGILKASPYLYKPGTVIPGRGTGAMAAESTQVSLRGTLYELPAPLAWVSPLVLDLNGDSILNASRGLWLPHPSKLTGPYAAFDLDGNGFKDITEWIGVGDGLLTTSTNPVSGRDLLGSTGGWSDGFEHLAALFDLDHNGRVEGAELNGLYLWQDLNTNGIADLGEVVPVQSLGIAWISATNSGDYTASFGYTNSTPGTVWDWWPNYALANRPGGTSSVSRILLPPGANLDAYWSSPPVIEAAKGINSPNLLLSMGNLAAAGIDLETFRMACLADGGQAIIGYDIEHGPPDQVRLLRIRPGPNPASPIPVDAISLNFEEVFQLAPDPAGRWVLVLGNHGSRLALVDFNEGTVTPTNGLDLRSIGLRASGLAGDPGVRFGGTGLFWFTAWQMDDQGRVSDERVWALTPWGFWGGLSLQGLRNQWGQLRSYYLTGPTSGYFVTPTPGGTNETLWWVWSNCDTCHVAIAQADSFGGMYATVVRKSGGEQQEGLSYTWRTNAVFGWDYWQSLSTVGDTCHVALATSSLPYFYLFLTDGGGTAIAAQLSPAAGTITYFAASDFGGGVPPAPGPAHITPLYTNYPGQGKVSLGAFAHYGTNGIELIAVPDQVPPAASSQVWTYTLGSGSQFIDHSPLGNRPDLLLPMRGSFQLRLIQENPLFSTYAWDTIAWTAGTNGGPVYKITGQGLYEYGGEVGLLQNLLLAVYVDDGQTNRLCFFTNGVCTVQRPWPMIQISVDQTNGTAIQQFHLDIAAAPQREIWFSTTQGFHAGIWPAASNYVSPGDLISSAGRIVMRNQDLTRNLGIMPIVPDVGLKDVDVLPGGEIAFSIESNPWSETLRTWLQHGDLLSDRGRIIRTNQDLISPFVPMPPVPDVGLDAVQVMANGDIYFSVQINFFSEKLDRPIRRGDLLSSSGVIVKTNEELIARFLPAVPNQDYGLAAIYVWPSGEIWFSTEDGFYGSHFEHYAQGDLLSDQGYVVFHNLDLLAPFGPVEDLADFGLDALYMVTDAGPPPPATTALRCTGVGLQPATGNVTLQWEGPGHVFQVEKATNILGPWLPLSPILTEPPVTDPGAITNSPQGFYRLRQW